MFNIDTSKDKLRQLIADHERLIADPLDISLAEKCCQDAWHLADWDLKDQQKVESKLTKEHYRNDLFQRCPEMRVLHDLSNTMKHKTLTTPKGQINATKIHRGGFSPGFSKGSNVPRLQVHFDNNQQIDVDDLVKIAIAYWTKNLL